MIESLQTSAQLTTVVEVDITSVSRLRDSAKGEFAQREGVKLSFMPFFAKAAIDALKEHPKLNAAIDTEKGEVTYYDRENIAIAVDTEKGLLTPVIKDAETCRSPAWRQDRRRGRAHPYQQITPDELSGDTFTLTNTGSRGALSTRRSSTSRRSRSSAPARWSSGPWSSPTRTSARRSRCGRWSTSH